MEKYQPTLSKSQTTITFLPPANAEGNGFIPVCVCVCVCVCIRVITFEPLDLLV